MLEFLESAHEDILDAFIVRIVEYLEKGLVKTISGKLFDQFKDPISEFGLLQKHSHLGTIALRFILLQLNIESVEEDKIEVLFIDKEKAENLILYFMIKSLVDLSGRADGIQLFKDYAEFIAKKAPPSKLEGFKAMRDIMVRMGDSGGFKHAIHDFDENMFLAKFDSCVVYDSLKDVDDQELAYYSVCYPGMTVGNRRDWCVRMRRTQTLFSGDFCDELYWNREVHDEPEQPKLEFSRKMVID